MDANGIETIGIIDYKCKWCGNTKSYYKKTNTGNEFGICTKCDKLTFSTLGGFHEPGPKSITVTCPYCNSTNCKKISAASKVGKVALFGVFAAGSVSKTWHCNSCGSNFG